MKIINGLSDDDYDDDNYYDDEENHIILISLIILLLLLLLNILMFTLIIASHADIHRPRNEIAAVASNCNKETINRSLFAQKIKERSK